MIRPATQPPFWEESPPTDLEKLRVRAAHQVHHFVGKFEGRGLEGEVSPRRAEEEEPEVDVHDVPRGIEEDVAVVPVLELQQVARHAVRGEGPHEVQSRFVERHECRQRGATAAAAAAAAASAATVLARPLAAAELLLVRHRCHVVCRQQRLAPCPFAAATAAAPAAAASAAAAVAAA